MENLRALKGHFGTAAGFFSAAALIALVAQNSASAQFGTSYLAFEGSGVITDNPTSSTCQTAGYDFGNAFGTVYRFTLNPSATPDALTFISRNHIYRIVSTQSPNFSLNGPSTVNWDSITSHGSYATLTGSSSNLTILSGINGAVSSSTGNIKITGTINDFTENSGCQIHFHAALVARPN